MARRGADRDLPRCKSMSTMRVTAGRPQGCVFLAGAGVICRVGYFGGAGLISTHPHWKTRGLADAAQKRPTRRNASAPRVLIAPTHASLVLYRRELGPGG